MSKVISFDIWDTIIKRKCHPEEIKLKTAQYIYLTYWESLKDDYKDIYELLKYRDHIEAELCSKAENNGLDAECKIEEVFDILINNIFVKKMDVTSNELLKVEIQNEKNVIYVNPDILPVFEEYKDLDMYCVSDFYMGSDSLKELLDYLKLPVKFKKIFSSADYMLNKRTGNLFKKFEKELKIDAKDHIHVGDNVYSDIEVPNGLGITTIKIETSKFDFEPKRDRKMNFDLVDLYKDNSLEENRIYNAGVDLAPLLYFFVYSIIEKGIQGKVGTIYYQTREGETFIKVHDLINDRNPFGVNLPKSKVMEVSRMATFSASLNEFSVMELLRLWSQYRNQSLKTLFKTMNINANAFMPYFEKYGLDYEEEIIEPWFDLRIQKLCLDEDFKNEIQIELDNKRNNLKEYFEKQLSIVNEDGSLFVVDIGWRGTIQDNLAYIFDKKKIDGYYLTLYDYYNLQPANTKKYSFIDDVEIRDKEVANIITLLEWIFNPGTGSVVEYKNGKAIRRAKNKEIQVVKKYIKPMQEGMLAGCKMINEYMKNHPYEACEGKNVVYELIRDIKRNPKKELIDAYYNMVFNDIFGNNVYIDQKGKLSFFQKFNIFKCRNILRKENWKEAYIVYNNLWYMNILLKLKGNIRKLFKK